MKELCADDRQREHLDKLVGLVRSQTLTGTEAWNAFSSPSNRKSYKRGTSKSVVVNFTDLQLETYRQLRAEVQKALFRRTAGCCSYCRRPVGHYGWAWHIEHVLPKSKYKARTFSLSNLTVGCVHCNQWKGARVDRNVSMSQPFPIINPISDGFRYSDHLRYLQFSTESIGFAKYSSLSDSGAETYRLLSFGELERAQGIDGLDETFSALHERITQAMGAGMASDDDGRFVSLLAGLKSSIYRVKQ